MYVLATLITEDDVLIAVESITSVSEGKVTAAKISNGRATLKIYMGSQGGSVESYSGNDTVEMSGMVFSTSAITFGESGNGVSPEPIIGRTITVKFINGIGTVSAVD
jgi:hypothetical protein